MRCYEWSEEENIFKGRASEKEYHCLVFLGARLPFADSLVEAELLARLIVAWRSAHLRGTGSRCSLVGRRLVALIALCEILPPLSDRWMKCTHLSLSSSSV